MIKKNDKGVTLIILMLTVIVITVLTSIIIYTGMNILKNANIENINTNMFLIQAKAKTISEKHKFEETQGLIGTKITGTTGIQSIDKLISEDIIKIPTDANALDAEFYYYFTQEDLDSIGLNKVSSNEKTGYYIVNYSDYEVINSIGVEDSNGTIYYSLSSMEDLIIED